MRLQSKVQQVTLLFLSIEIYRNGQFLGKNWVLGCYLGGFYHLSLHLFIDTNSVTCCTLLYSLIYSIACNICMC